MTSTGYNTCFKTGFWKCKQNKWENEEREYCRILISSLYDLILPSANKINDRGPKLFKTLPKYTEFQQILSELIKSGKQIKTQT